MKTSLAQLPTEIIEAIISLLPVTTIVACSQVSQQWRHLVLQSPYLQYKVDLRVAGLEDNSSFRPDLSIAERHNQLRLHSAAWDRLQWNSTEDFTIYYGPWEFLSGILVTSDGSGLDQFNLGLAPKDTRFKFKQPPSVYTHSTERCWEICLADIRVHDFIVDPSQDLLVAAEDLVRLHRKPCHLHVLSMTTGKSHDHAEVPRIDYQPSLQAFEFMAIKFQVQGHFLGALFSSSSTQAELVVWDWKRGIIHQRIIGIILAFAFLTDGFLLFVSKATLAAADVPVFNVIDLARDHAQTTNLGDVEYVCTFEYPPIPLDLSPWQYTMVEIRTDPLSFVPDSALFNTSSADQLFVITCVVQEASVLVVPLSTFMAHIRLCLPKAYGDQKSPRFFSFQEWGQMGSRIFFVQPSDVWICYAHGMKFIVLEEGADNMLVFDFNRLALRKAEANPSNNPSTMEIVTSQSSVNPILDELQTSPLTESDLTTSLPYRVKKVPVPQRPGEDPVQAVMISETSIIAVLSVEEDMIFRILSF